MYEQFTEQFQTSMKPVTALMEINIKAVEALAEQQASFFTSAMNDSLAYTQDISSQTDLASLLKVQKEYSEDFSDKLITATKDMYAVMVESQDKKNAILKEAFTKVQEMASTMTVAPKPAPKRKSAAK
jgi:phasin family protein